jgi:putative salt-induced outer membrane protein YdiY
MRSIRSGLATLICCSVTGIACAQPALTEVRLASGEVIRVTVIESTETHLRCVHPVLGEFSIPHAQATILVPTETPPPADAPVSEPAAATAPDSALDAAIEDAPAAPPPKLSFWTGWKRTVDLGILGAEGNTESFGARAALGAQRKTEYMETTVGLSYVYSSDNGEKTKSRGELTGRNDWLFGKDSRWGVFAEAKLEYDEFQDWDWRLSGFVGPSYAFIRNEKTLLRGRVGAGGTYEIGGDNEGFEPSLLIGLDYEHQLNARNKLFASAEYLPSLSDFPDYRANAKAGWEVLVDEKSNMNLKLGVADRYDSNPGEGIEKNDIEYFVTLGWGF